MGIERRLEKLERHSRGEETPAHWPYEEWPADDQLEQALDTLDFHRHFRDPPHAFTDREINLLGIAAAYEELGGAGEWEAPHSGAAITLTDNEDGTFNAGLSANIAVEDLPEHIRPYVARMAPKQQEGRDVELYQERHSFEPWRERVRRVEEEHRRRSEESKRRDREFLKRNRAASGLPPLTPEQFKKLGL